MCRLVMQELHKATLGMTRRERAEKLAEYYYEARRTRSRLPHVIRHWSTLASEWKTGYVDAMEAALAAMEQEEP
jgi:hypothetical protein